MKVLRYLIFGDPPTRGLSPRRWRRFVRIQTPHVARWLRLNEVDRQLTLEHDVRERFDPVSSLGEPLQIEWGPLTGGSWDPVNGWVNLTEDEIRERHPEFYRLATLPLAIYDADGSLLRQSVTPVYDPAMLRQLKGIPDVVMLDDDAECPSDRLLVECVPCGQRFSCNPEIRSPGEIRRLGHGLGCRGRFPTKRFDISIDLCTNDKWGT